MRVARFVLAFCLAASPALASRWSVSKNETDPFDKTKTTFVALTNENGHTIAVRCLESGLSFAVTVSAGDAAETDELTMKVVADEKPPIEAEAGTLNANAFIATVQFGNESTVEYLRGAKKYWLRLANGTKNQTLAFTGGPSFEDALNKARKACGVADAPAAKH